LNLSEYFQQLFDYHYWANWRMFAVAETLSQEQLFRQQEHSWGSVYGVLLHMMNAEWIWLQRWQGESPTAFFSSDDFPTLASVKKYWTALEAEMRTFIANQTPQTLEAEITYTTTLGQMYHLSLWLMMAHVANHGTHHRGELAAMFASMDTPHPEDELIHYALKMGGQRA